MYDSMDFTGIIFAICGAVGIFMVLLWVLHSIMLSRLAKAAGCAYPWAAWVPIGMIPLAVWIVSMELAAPVGRDIKKVWLMAFLMFIPLVNAFAMIVLLIYFFGNMSNFCREFGKSMLLNLILIMLLPGIGNIIVINGMRKAVEEMLPATDI